MVLFLFMVFLSIFGIGIHLFSQQPEGEIIGIDEGKKEIHVKNPPSGAFRMGEKLSVHLGDKVIELRVVFPMLSFSRCTLMPQHQKHFPELSKGMPVYRGVAKNAKSEKKEPKTGTVKKVGGIEFVYIRGGTFWMGSPDGEGNADEHPRHEVEVDSFWMAKYEITEEQYEKVMGKKPNDFNGNSNLPVAVSWLDAVEFCNKASKKAGLSPCYEIDTTKREPDNLNEDEYDSKYVHRNEGCIGFRLPTEAEWEYAARAGTTTKYYWGDDIDGRYCWHISNSDSKIQPVGKKLPNAWGLYDMAGNVSEWCEDWYEATYYRESPLKNPTGPKVGWVRVHRGGDSIWNSTDIRSANRGACTPNVRYYGGHNCFNIGFRPVLPATQK